MAIKKITQKKATKHKQSDDLPTGVPIICGKHILDDEWILMDLVKAAKELQDTGLSISIDQDSPYEEVCIATDDANKSTLFFDKLSKFFDGGISIKHK